MNGCEHPVYVSPCAEKKRAFGVSMRFEFLPVGVDVLDDPRSNKFCFLNGYWYVATRKASAFSSRTVGDAGPYKV